MSLHSNKKDFICPKCSVIFIPYNATFECPKCGYVGITPNEYLDFIDLCVCSLKANKQEFGSFIPSAWFSNCFSDRIQSDLFKLFTMMEDQKPVGMERFIDETVVHLGMENYLQKYLKKLFFEVKLAYDKQPEISTTSISTFKDRLRTKLKTLLP